MICIYKYDFIKYNWLLQTWKEQPTAYVFNNSKQKTKNKASENKTKPKTNNLEKKKREIAKWKNWEKLGKVGKKQKRGIERRAAHGAPVHGWADTACFPLLHDQGWSRGEEKGFSLVWLWPRFWLWWISISMFSSSESEELSE